MNFLSAEPHSDFLKIIWDPRKISIVSNKALYKAHCIRVLVYQTEVEENDMFPNVRCDGVVDCAGWLREDEGEECQLLSIQPSCRDWLTKGYTDSGKYFINPGQGGGFQYQELKFIGYITCGFK